MNKKIILVNKTIQMLIMFSPTYVCHIVGLWILSAPYPYYLYIIVDILTFILIMYTTLFLNAYLKIEIDEKTYDIVKWEWNKPSKNEVIYNVMKGVPYFLCMITFSFFWLCVYCFIQITSVFINKEGKAISERLIRYFYKEDTTIKVII